MPNKQLGFDIVYSSNVTIGGGISSSAAVEVFVMLGQHVDFDVFIH